MEFMQINKICHWKGNNHINHFHMKTIQCVKPEKHIATYYMGDSYCFSVSAHV